MSLNSLIITTLQPLGVPVSFQTFNGNADTYITFFEFNQRSHVDADDKEVQTQHSIQIDLWSKGDYTTLVKQVRDALIGAGFVRAMETEYYEDELRIYHKVLRFNYVKGVN